MTIDEAIRHCEEVAEKQDKLCEISVTERAKEQNSKCAEDHRQLAEWLKELKASRECIEHIRKACLCPGLRGDGFEEEIVEAMNEYLYDMGKEWEE